MCVEEHDQLLENGSPSKDFTKQRVSARKQYAFIFTVAVCAAFAAGFFSTSNNTPLLFRSKLTSSSDNAVRAYADRGNDWDDMANANHTNNNLVGIMLENKRGYSHSKVSTFTLIATT